MQVDATFGLTIALGVALLFASGAWHKFRAIDEFVATFGAYEIVPRRLIPAVARALPLLELLTALLLLLPQTRVVGMMDAAALLLAYAAAMGINLKRGRRHLDCGCGVAGQRGRITAWMVWRNAALAVVLLLALPPWAARSLGIIDLLTIAAATLIAALLYQSAHLLLGLAPGSARPGGSS